MTTSCAVPDTSPTPAWSVGGLLLEALAARDFVRMAACFTPDATMRALTPRGLRECEGATQIAEILRSWFGDADEFEVLDGTVGEVGGRMHVAWRLRLRPTPSGQGTWHVVKQQAYLRTGERIEAIDLLCSGFQPDPHA